jgi:DNA end-binding protein Ku
VREGVLVLATMLYADEVIAPEEMEVPTVSDTAPTERELDMAAQLVESLSAPFEPEKYHDDYREKVLALIEAKADGEIITAPAAPETTAPVVDLMAALEASLARAKNSA